MANTNSTNAAAQTGQGGRFFIPPSIRPALQRFWKKGDDHGRTFPHAGQRSDAVARPWAGCEMWGGLYARHAAGHDNKPPPTIGYVKTALPAAPELIVGLQSAMRSRVFFNRIDVYITTAS